MKTPLFAVAPLLLAAAAARGVEIQAAVDGRAWGALSAYAAGPVYYLPAKEAGRLYGSPVYWYPMAGRVQLRIKGRVARFMMDSSRAEIDGKPVQLKEPVLVRAGQAMIPLSFFLSPEFEFLAGWRSAFEPKTRLLTVSARSSVGSLRYYSYPGRTRLVLGLGAGLPWKLARRGARDLEISVPGGIVGRAEKVDIQDGVVGACALRQDGAAARLTARLEGASSWETAELGSPRRLVLDIRGQAREAAGRPEPARPAPRSPAERAAQARARKRRIVIDPGHGGRDPGATGRRGTLEKEINLLAARELAELLRQEAAFDVRLTREEDRLVPLADRSRLANEFEADLFVSLHCNAHKDARESGFEIYFLSEKASDPEAERLAEFENSVLRLEEAAASGTDEAAPILVAMAKAEHMNEASELAGLMTRALDARTDLGRRAVKQADFYVLRGTNSPAVLVELGFLTSARDEALLESAEYRGRVVDGLYAGLLEYAKRQAWLGEGAGGPAR